MDVWTRVTSSLFVIHMDRQFDGMSRGLKDSLTCQVAIEADEKNMMSLSFCQK